MGDGYRTWSEQWVDDNTRWPDTTLIRMLKGNWPECNFNKEDYKKQRMLDVGCGDASNFPLYKQCGFKEICGVEISDEIIRADTDKINRMGIIGSIITGNNGNIPFPDSYFDYIISWNAFYYMGWKDDYACLCDYVYEFSRCMTKGGGTSIFHSC